jgi:hypothetical protein
METGKTARRVGIGPRRKEEGLDLVEEVEGVTSPL